MQTQCCGRQLGLESALKVDCEREEGEMDHLNYEFSVGIAVGKLLLGALFVSPLFRNVVISAGAAFVCWLFVHAGVDGILDLARALQKDFVARPSFSKGALVGAALAFVAFGLIRRRRVS
jgi:hypothetical protein